MISRLNLASLSAGHRGRKLLSGTLTLNPLSRFGGKIRVAFSRVIPEAAEVRLTRAAATSLNAGRCLALMRAESPARPAARTRVSTTGGDGSSTLAATEDVARHRPNTARRVVAVAGLTLTGLLYLSPPSALAFSPTHNFTNSFGAANSTPANPYPLSNPTEIAVDNSAGSSAHDVYVTDPANHRVEKFGPAGNLILMFGKDVDKTTGASVCTTASGDTCKAGLSGSSPGELEEPTYIAVDGSLGASAGDVYVGDTADNTISKFTPEGSLIESWSTNGQLHGVDATGTGTLESGSPVIKSMATATGAFIVGQQISGPGIPTGSSITAVEGDGDLEISASATTSGVVSLSADKSFLSFDGIAVDASGTLYVLDEGGPNQAGKLFEFTQSGSFSKDFTPGGGETHPQGLTVDSTGDIFKSSSGGGGITKLNPIGDALIEGMFFFNINSRYYTGTGFTIDPATNDLYIDSEGEIGRVDSDTQYTLLEEPFGFGHLNNAEGLTVDASNTTVYAANTGAGDVAVFEYGFRPEVTTGPVENPKPTSATLTGTVDPAGAETTSCRFEYGSEAGNYDLGSVPCEPATPYASQTAVTADLTNLTAETTYHYRLVASNGKITGYGTDQAFLDHAVEGLETEAATNVEPTTATLNGSFMGNGEDTHYHFEYVTEEHFNQEGFAHATSAPVPDADAGSPSAPTKVNVNVEGLTQVTEYHFRLVASSHFGITHANELIFKTPASAPVVTTGSVSAVHSESSLLNGQIDPGGSETTYHFEYGTSECSTESCTKVPIPDGALGSGISYLKVSAQINGLLPGTIYHYRLVATNTVGTTDGRESTFSTFPFTKTINDTCPNGLARQQTGAALVLDCRAYELVSSANAGGYNVESDLVPGQTPYAGYPEAENPPRVLYGVHDGGIPGTNHPTNRGVDPYVATRGKEGWTTEYVGIPTNNPFAAEPFSSVPSGSSAGLETFAFGGAEGCSPCFEGGYTGVPVRLSNGELVQGMLGAHGFEPGPTATSDGYIAADLSANGEHLIFGSTSRFAEGGNSNGEVSIYDRNLTTHETHVISNTPSAEDPPASPLLCLQGSGECNAAHHDSNGIAELAISPNGSHILLGQKVSEDADHNVYWHLYMELNDSIRSVDLTPEVIASHGGAGFKEGVLFNGMSADGTRVFFTTKDALTTASSQDTDASADLYQAEVSESGHLTLTRVSTGVEGTGNTDACDPVSNANGEHWNTVDSAKDCGVVAIGGGGGVASESGSIYFLSPEKLDGSSNGTANQPNLYLAAPGSAPSFIATLSPDDAVVLDSVKEAEVRHTADFQVTPSGEFAVFSTSEPLDETFENAGFSEVYRYDAEDKQLVCASCDPTNESATGDANLASNGLSLADDGQVFFNTGDALVLRDSDNRQDVYEWEPEGIGTCNSESPDFYALGDDCVGLISAGSSPFDSKLLGVSADGIDVYFFTYDTLAAQDHNGPIVKIYDARSNGGVFEVPQPPPCASSDECHGPGSQAPGPAEIRANTGSPANYIATVGCKSGFIRKHGGCVRKTHKVRRHHKRAARHHRGGKK